jgi:hypothetical protein
VRKLDALFVHEALAKLTASPSFLTIFDDRIALETICKCLISLENFAIDLDHR